MPPEAAPDRRSRYGHQVVIAAGLGTFYLFGIWAVASSTSLSASLSPLGIVFFTPLIMGLTLFAFSFIAVYGLLAFVLGISFYLQHKRFSRSQLVTVLIMALAAGGIPVAYCVQTGRWHIAVLPFVLLQGWLAVASILESRWQLNPRT